MIHGLYVITPNLLDTDELLRQVELVIRHGARILQYRNKLASPQVAHSQAKELRALTQSLGVTFIVNDSLSLAEKVSADGIHLGEEDGDLLAARAILPSHVLLGASCYNDPSLVEKAMAAGVSYIALGTLFHSKTKPFARHAGLEFITQMRARVSVPIVAIGGITPSNASQVIEAGADSIAVMSAIFDAPDIAAMTQQFSNLYP